MSYIHVHVPVHVPFFANADDETTQQESHETKLHPPTSAEASGDGIEPPVAKRLKLSTPATAAPKENGEQNHQAEEENPSKVSSERLKSLSDVPTEMSFEAEIPILEKPITSSTATTNLQSSNELQQSSSAQEMEDCSGDRGYATEKMESLGVFFETTVRNSNLLHVCCQLNEGSGAAKAGKATGEEGGGGMRGREGERSGDIPSSPVHVYIHVHVPKFCMQYY
jgi:hypothetical protein